MSEFNELFIEPEWLDEDLEQLERLLADLAAAEAAEAGAKAAEDGWEPRAAADLARAISRKLLTAARANGAGACRLCRM